eukprot:1607112-Rhodomonas_salina.1
MSDKRACTWISVGEGLPVMMSEVVLDCGREECCLEGRFSRRRMGCRWHAPSISNGEVGYRDCAREQNISPQ